MITKGRGPLKNLNKYQPQYYMPPVAITDWISKDRLTKAPIWCSVDLRDGNQSLITPMSFEEKLAYYKFLLQLGFKEIEVGFPAASDTEYDFMRTLIDENLIPDDVTIQVLMPSRPHNIDRTFDAIRGANRAIVHLYNSTSFAQRQQVFRLSEDGIIDLALDGAKRFNQLAAEMPETKFIFEYSPESFTGTEPEFALRVCNAIIDTWQPSAARPVIINLPATVETSMPHVFAQQVAYMNRHLHCREHVILSIHPHNDRGTGIAAAEMGLLAGADRVEGTLFGNGERTGNVDLITLALNLYTHGVNPGLDLSDMPRIVRTYEEATGLPVSPRHPYAGELVFAAFSGTHQDAIAKGLRYRKEHNEIWWNVPYLPLDPSDVNREYETSVIRINSQSGKSGIAYILEQRFGYHLPKELSQAVGGFITAISDRAHKELEPQEIFDAFAGQYINISTPIKLVDVNWKHEGKRSTASLELTINGTPSIIQGQGNGSLDAVSDALRRANPQIEFRFDDYVQHAIESESAARAAAYVKISDKAGKPHWGVGVHNDITTASVLALISAVNRVLGQ